MPLLTVHQPYWFYSNYVSIPSRKDVRPWDGTPGAIEEMRANLGIKVFIQVASALSEPAMDSVIDAFMSGMILPRTWRREYARAEHLDKPFGLLHPEEFQDFNMTHDTNPEMDIERDRHRHIRQGDIIMPRGALS